MNNRINIKSLVISIAIPLAVGGLAAFITMGSMQDFEALNKPPLSPPGWLFPVVWTLLYILMGVGSYLVLESKSPTADKKRALKLYFLQLGFNFFWSIIFFTLGAYELAFLWLVILFVLILATSKRFWRINPLAGMLMIPYALWVSFAGYLNLVISRLN